MSLIAVTLSTISIKVIAKLFKNKTKIEVNVKAKENMI